MIYYNQAFHQGPARLTISMNCKGDGSMKTNWIEDVKKQPAIFLSRVYAKFFGYCG